MGKRKMMRVLSATLAAIMLMTSSLSQTTVYAEEVEHGNGFKKLSPNWFKTGEGEEGDWNENYAPNAIDPTVFYGADGKLYMVYGSWSGGLFIHELDKQTGEVIYPGEDGTDETSGNFIDRYFGTHIAGGNHQSGEGSYIQYDKETGYYYLYETYGGLLSTGGYNMRLFRSENVYGPYVDAKGQNAAKNGNNNTQYGIKLIGNYQFDGQTGYRSAGHNSVLTDDDGSRYIVYHQRFEEEKQTERHELRVHQQFINEDKWPVTAVYEYRGEKIGHYDDSEVVGEYEVIDHGTDSSGNMLETKSLTLNADGTVSGDLNGTWEKKAAEDYDYVTIQIDNATYKGVFFAQQNEADNPQNVMTFTTIGDNNECLWGSKKSIATEEESNEAADTDNGAKRVSVHDPSIVKSKDGKYYVFGSHLANAKSDDLIEWEQMTGDYYKFEWKTESIYGDILNNLAETFRWAGYDDGDCINGGLGMWAPDVTWNPDYINKNGSKGAYMIFYSASSTWKRSCIGYAVSTNIEGPYEYVDTVIYSGFTKHGEADNGLASSASHSDRSTKWNNDYLNLVRLINNYNNPPQPIQPTQPDPVKPAVKTPLAVGKTIAALEGSVKVTSSLASAPEVMYVAPASKTAKSVKVPDQITADGITYKVTQIAPNAFRNNKKLTSVTIGKNITEIGKNAFSGCKKLKKITVNSTVLKKVGSKALKGIYAKATIKVPKKQLKKYKKLFKGKGQAKTVKIK